MIYSFLSLPFWTGQKHADPDPKPCFRGDFAKNNNDNNNNNIKETKRCDGPYSVKDM